MTGGDDLRGGTNPRDNCDATVTFRDGASATIRNINDNQHWGNNETHTVVLPIPDKYVAGDIVKFALSTNFGGGLSGDNWNVNHVSLVASLTGSRKVIPPMPNPVARTWLSSNGNPIVRFTGSTRDWGAQIEVAAGDKTRVIENLQLTIQTGGDDLRGGSDNASVLLTFGGNQVTTANINAGAHWNNNETHTVALNFPAGAKAGDLARFDLHTQFGGGTGGDNWNVNKLVLEATLSG